MTKFYKQDELLVVTVEEARLDAAAAPAFKAALHDNVVGQPRYVVVDLSAVEFLDSTGLGTLVSLMKMMGGHGTLALAGPQPPVRRLLQITQLDRVFRLFDTQPEAEAALRGR
jgi:anti-sigma B factor antagonist